MRVAVSSSGPGLEDAVSPIFGRCPYLLLVDSETMEARSLVNAAVSASGGAGVQASQMLVREGAQAVIGANVGPNAAQVLLAAGVPVYQVSGGTVREAVEAFRKGTLKQLSTPNVGTNYGKGAGLGRQGRGAGAGRAQGPRGG